MSRIPKIREASFRLAAAGWLVFGAGLPAFAGDLIPAGPVVVLGDGATVEFPLIESAPGDRYVVVWAQESGAGCAMKGRFYNSDGSPDSLEFEIATASGCLAAAPRAVGVNADGSFIVARHAGTDISAQRVDSSGALVGSPFVLGPVVNVQRLDILPVAGGFYVSRDAVDALYLRHYDVAGVPTTAEYLVVDKIGCCGQLYHGVAVTGNGDLVVAWPDRSSPSHDIVAQTFAPDGSTVTPQFQVSVGGAPGKSAHAVAESDGGYTVFWYSQADMLVSSVRFDSTDTPVGGVVSFPLFTVDLIGLTRSPNGYVFLAPRYGFELLHRLDSSREPVGKAIPAVSYRTMEATSVAVDGGGNLVILQTYQVAHYPDRLQRFCDSDDPGCDRCNGFDDTVDDDGDGIPNACDICTNVSGDRTMEKPRMFVTRGGAAKIQKFRVRGIVTLPVAFSEIDPSADGFRVALLSPAYGHVVNDRLATPDAATGSWELRGTSAWRFRGEADFGSSAGRGEWRIKIKALGGPTSNRVRVTAGNSRGSFWFITDDSLDLPPRLVFNFGEESEAESDLCGEAIFDVENCRTKDGNNPSIRCR